MCASANPTILSDCDSGSFAAQTLLVSIWELGEVLRPFLLALFSELYGRLPVYHCAVILFILLSIACATSANPPMLLVFRFLIGITPSTGTLNSPIIADVSKGTKRPCDQGGTATKSNRDSNWANSWQLLDRREGVALGFLACCYLLWSFRMPVRHLLQRNISSYHITKTGQANEKGDRRITVDLEI